MCMGARKKAPSQNPEPSLMILVNWKRITKGILWLACKRKEWAYLGQLLNEINMRGKILRN